MTEDHPEERIPNRLYDVLADAREVVLHWREAYAHLREVPAEGAEAKGLRTEMQQLRDEYARLIEEARHHGRERAQDASFSDADWEHRLERAPVPNPTLGVLERDA